MGEQQQQCFHCGTLLRATHRIQVQVAGEYQHVCCAGCQSVVEALATYSVYQTCQGDKNDETD